MVVESLDVLLFTRMRNSSGARKPGPVSRRIFGSSRGLLWKYIKTYAEGRTVFCKGDEERDVFYILSGEAEVYLDQDKIPGVRAAVLKQGMFFGEMEALLDEKRTATVRAVKELTVLVLPPELFQRIIRSDAATDRLIIKNLSERLKNTNEKYLTLSRQAAESGCGNGPEEGRQNP